jgi:DNA polymerase III delta prime subunit
MDQERIQTNRILILGQSGTGKTTLALELAEQYLELGRREFHVTVSKDASYESALARLADSTCELTDERADAGIDWRRLLEAHPRLYVEVSAIEPFKALDGLGAALMQLGSALVIVDEANELAGASCGKQWLALWTRGRKRWIDVIAIGQSPLQSGQMGIHREISKRSNALVSFQLRDPREAAAAAKWLEVNPDQISRLRTPHDSGAPEYIVTHADTGRAQLIARSGVEALAS